MKIAIATLSIFAAVTSASLFDSVLTLAGPLIQKTKCAVPCIYGAGNKIPCGAQGPFATICDNAQGIYTESKSCVAQCGVDDKVGQFVLKYVQEACAKRTAAPTAPTVPTVPM